ncbi:MAG: hypothetical protein OXH69_04165 [Acidobacteria bacterium]|nr:hypothetical protein [Acidobacteriota bacterium]
MAEEPDTELLAEVDSRIRKLDAQVAEVSPLDEIESSATKSAVRGNAATLAGAAASNRKRRGELLKEAPRMANRRQGSTDSLERWSTYRFFFEEHVVRGVYMRDLLAPSVGMIGAALVVLLSIPAATEAQTPLDPASMWISCWGYNVTDGRQYNCVGSVARTAEADRFFPTAGQSCTGSVKQFSLDRKGVQINCADTTEVPGRLWTIGGVGPDYFAKPADAVRVRIKSGFHGSSDSFIVYCGENLIVNELVGTDWGNTGTDGYYRMLERSGDPCTEVRVGAGQDVTWVFEKQPSLTAYTPPRSWSDVSGAGLDLDAEALQDLANAVELERAAGR